ncbi:hypothetical protein HYU12_04420 [Candidatus Woesearchaeota archaeon]|nr:hypothetical protein [Candidatus Woesearchaeota archaeon]
MKEETIKKAGIATQVIAVAAIIGSTFAVGAAYPSKAISQEISKTEVREAKLDRSAGVLTSRIDTLTRLIGTQYPIVASTLQAYGLPVPESPEGYCNTITVENSFCATVDELSAAANGLNVIFSEQKGIEQRIAALQLKSDKTESQQFNAIMKSLGGIGILVVGATTYFLHQLNKQTHTAEPAQGYATN